MEYKLEEFRKKLLDNDYPLDIDEILGEIQYLFEGDKEVYKKMDSYIDDFTEMWHCAEKFYKAKDLVDEQFYSEE
jgi:hypothetical protein